MLLLEHIKLLYRAWKYRYVADRCEIRFIMQTIKIGDTVFDVGAHKGGYTYWMKKAVGKNGTVIAFEPQRKGAELLRKIYRANVKTEQLALSDHKATTLLYIQPQSFDVSFEASLSNRYESSVTEEVHTTTIDAYCRENNFRPSFIKIDVEGHEEKLLEGASETLLSAKPVLLVEIEIRHIGEEKILRLLSKIELIGYRGFFFHAGKKLCIDEFRADLHQNINEINSGLYSNNFVFDPI
jgi:FkbM family methyltransferase